jgi:hypothetical protein
MFSLNQETARVVSVNPRAEKHGETPVVACDIDLDLEMPASVLDQFASGLRAALYVKAKQEEEPELRFDGVLGRLRIKTECLGYKAQVKWGDLAGSVDVTLADCKVHKFSVEPKQGGTCGVHLQIQAHPDERGLGQLCFLIARECEVSVTPPGEGP